MQILTIIANVLAVLIMIVCAGLYTITMGTIEMETKFGKRLLKAFHCIMALIWIMLLAVIMYS